MRQAFRFDTLKPASAKNNNLPPSPLAHASSTSSASDLSAAETAGTATGASRCIRTAASTKRTQAFFWLDLAIVSTRAGDHTTNRFRTAAADIAASGTDAAGANPFTSAATTKTVGGAGPNPRATGNAFRAATTGITLSHSDASSAAARASDADCVASSPSATTSARNAAAASHTQSTMAGIDKITADTTNASACAGGAAPTKASVAAAPTSTTGATASPTDAAGTRTAGDDGPADIRITRTTGHRATATPKDAGYFHPDSIGLGSNRATASVPNAACANASPAHDATLRSANATTRARTGAEDPGNPGKANRANADSKDKAIAATGAGNCRISK